MTSLPVASEVQQGAVEELGATERCLAQRAADEDTEADSRVIEPKSLLDVNAIRA
jgi:hypothetical protein